MKIPTIPEIYQNMPGHTLLSIKDVLKMFGYPVKNLNYHLNRGNIPPPDILAKRKGRTKTRYWRLSTIRKVANVQ